jgi:serine/threonine protein kinase
MLLNLYQSFVGEAVVWRQCTHPNLLPFYGISRWKESSARVCLVSPWMENGNISDHLKLNPDTPRLPLVRDFIHYLAVSLTEHFP